jgi:hypothetical protein
MEITAPGRPKALLQARVTARATARAVEKHELELLLMV